MTWCFRYLYEGFVCDQNSPVGDCFILLFPPFGLTSSTKPAWIISQSRCMCVSHDDITRSYHVLLLSVSALN